MVMGELTEETEVLVIGAGPGGYASAFRAADLGMDVAMVDAQERPGGECLFRGCIPSKALLYLAELLTDAKRSEAMGIKFENPQIDLERIRSWKDQVVDKLANGLVNLCKERNIQLIQGRAEFESSDTVRLRDSDVGKVKFRHVILSTGSYPRALPEIPFERESRIMDSAAALDLKDIPRSLLVVGGGYVALEMGTIYAALGSQVTVVVHRDRLLRGADADMVRPLKKRLGETFEAIHFHTTVSSMREKEDGVEVKLEGQIDKPEQFFDRVLVAVGRKPNSEDLGLENTRVKLDQRGFVQVDEQCRSTDEKILAVGDVARGPLLAHKAFHEGKVAAEVVQGYPSAFDVRAIPSVVYTHPQVAWCGLTEEEAEKAGREIAVVRYPWKSSSRARTMGMSEGATKMLLEPDSGRILGLAITGRETEGMISEGVLAMEMGALAEDVAMTVHPHPTLSETVGEAAGLFFGNATHILPKKKDQVR
jgi:dihydrolipoamide dehydrogenase